MKKFFIFLPFVLFSPWALSEVSHDLDSPPINLENTKLGEAIKNENLNDYREALKELENRPYQEAIEVLTAIDNKGNNVLHLMAQVKNHRESFAAEMLNLAVSLDQLDSEKILESKNNQNFSPKEIAREVKNFIAVKYLTTAENLIKRIRNEGLRATVSQETDSINLQIFFKRELVIKKAALGGMIFLMGITFFPAGISIGDPLITLIGAGQMLMGGRACYEAFKTRKKLN